MEERTSQTRINYDIISEMVLDIIKEKGKTNNIYVEFYKDSFLKNVIIIFDYDIENFCAKLFTLYQEIRKYNINKITRIDTLYTTTIVVR